MKKQTTLILLLTLLAISCSKEEEMNMMEPEPYALTITRIDGFVSTGSETFQVTNLLDNSVTENIQTISPFFVIFSKPVLSDHLSNESLPKILKTENGEPVADVSLKISSPSNQELLLEPVEELEPGTTYRLVINPGYKAEDGGILEEHAIVDFITVN